MVDVTYETATFAHAEALAPVMRGPDVAEVFAATGESPLEALARGVANSSHCVAVLFDGQPALIAGLVPTPRSSVLSNQPDCLWFLTGAACSKSPRTFIGCTQRLRDEFLKISPHLYNWVDDRYEGAKWLLRRLGVALSEPVPYGVHGELFRLGSIRRF